MLKAAAGKCWNKTAEESRREQKRAEESRREHDFETKQHRKVPLPPSSLLPPSICFSVLEKCCHAPGTDRQDGFPETNQGRDALIGKKGGLNNFSAWVLLMQRHACSTWKSYSHSTCCSQLTEGKAISNKWISNNSTWWHTASLSNPPVWFPLRCRTSYVPPYEPSQAPVLGGLPKAPFLGWVGLPKVAGSSHGKLWWYNHAFWETVRTWVR